MSDPIQWRYKSGKPYRALQPRLQEIQGLELPQMRQSLNLEYNSVSWPELWRIVQSKLRLYKYQPSSIRLYRDVLRGFSRYVKVRPAGVTKRDIIGYLQHVISNNRSKSWVRMVMSVLRTVFDKIGKLRICDTIQSKKEGLRIPDILSETQVVELIDSATNYRDKLLMGMMYSGGLKVSEVINIRWADIDVKSKTVMIRGEGDASRKVPMSEEHVAILEKGLRVFSGDEYIFEGSKKTQHISARAVRNIFKSLLKKVELPNHLSPMALRHSVAVHLLKNKSNIAVVKKLLGLKGMASLLMYKEMAEVMYHQDSHMNPLWWIKNKYPKRNKIEEGGRLLYRSMMKAVGWLHLRE